jgi:hypothetical protein
LSIELDLACPGAARFRLAPKAYLESVTALFRVRCGKLGTNLCGIKQFHEAPDGSKAAQIMMTGCSVITKVRICASS